MSGPCRLVSNQQSCTKTEAHMVVFIVAIFLLIFAAQEEVERRALHFHDRMETSKSNY